MLHRDKLSTAGKRFPFCRRSAKFSRAAARERRGASAGAFLNPGTHMKPTIRWAIPATLAASVLSGCLNLTPPATPGQSHGVALNAVSSARVQVNGPRFQMNHGDLELAGTISKKPGASTTAFSHLDILFYDRNGAVIVTKLLSFFPRMVGESRLSSRFGYYSLKLEPLPQGTAKISVRGDDGTIAAPHD
jgi:hypothetical protein